MRVGGYILTGLPLVIVSIVSWASPTPRALAMWSHSNLCVYGGWGGGAVASPRPVAQSVEINGAQLSLSYGFKIYLEDGPVSERPRRGLGPGPRESQPLPRQAAATG